jgi:lipopolysaccharide transport system permease protein
MTTDASESSIDLATNLATPADLTPPPTDLRSPARVEADFPEEKPLMELGPASGWAALNLREIWNYRDLLLVLAQRDVKLRYKQTALGVAWVVLQPLLAAGIFTFVGSILNAPSGGVPRFVFSFAGLLAYNAFSGTISKASACVVGNSQLVSKVYFPRLILPLSTVLATLIDFAVGMVLMIAMMFLYHIAPGWGILLLPIWLALLIGLAVGVGLYTAALMVRYRDLQYVIPVLVQLILYASPILYDSTAVPARWRIVFYLNPLSGLLEAFRWSLLGRGDIRWPAIAYSTIFVIVSFLFGAFAFKRMERHFADVI